MYFKDGSFGYRSQDGAVYAVSQETIEIAFYRKGNQLMDNKYYADCLFVEKQFQRRALRKLSVQ